jgi:hypothetical protein
VNKERKTEESSRKQKPALYATLTGTENSGKHLQSDVYQVTIQWQATSHLYIKRIQLTLSNVARSYFTVDCPVWTKNQNSDSLEVKVHKFHTTWCYPPIYYAVSDSTPLLDCQRVNATVWRWRTRPMDAIDRYSYRTSITAYVAVITINNLLC